MKINETITRDCCQSSDLKPYFGASIKGATHVKFCQYCGQLWGMNKEMGPAGSYDGFIDIIKIESWNFRK